MLSATHSEDTIDPGLFDSPAPRPAPNATARVMVVATTVVKKKTFRLTPHIDGCCLACDFSFCDSAS